MLNVMRRCSSSAEAFLYVLSLAIGFNIMSAIGITVCEEHQSFPAQKRAVVTTRVKTTLHHSSFLFFLKKEK